MNSKKIILICLVGLFLGGTLLSPQKSTLRIKGDGVGYVLLDDFIVLFEGAAGMKAEELNKKIKDGISHLVEEATKAKSTGAIDSLFFERYQRLLRVVRLIMIDDPEGLLTPLIFNEILQFDIAETEKLKFKEKMDQDSRAPHDQQYSKKGFGLGFTVSALAEEILSLKDYLDKKIKSGK